MAAQRRRFTVLSLGDLDKWGFNEQTLPLLVSLMDFAEPDYLDAIFSGVTGYFVTSPRAMIRVEKAVRGAEKLRDTDERFSSLGIGLAEGEMLARFNWWGGVKQDGMPPLGLVHTEAVRCSYDPNAYREKLQALVGKVTNQTV
jgi:hypothetical protein